jgi:hypothetical protein
MRDHFLLGEVGKVLGRQPHHITHVLTTGKVPEPQARIANKRLLVPEDVERLARHFRVAPNWSALEPAPTDADTKPPQRLTLRPPFQVIQSGETCHEIKDCNGEVFGWATDRGRALVVAGLLEAAARG